jgi:WD40 repeat protein
MNDLFISYAREDLEFVRGLKEALEREGAEVWVDLEGIAAGEDFGAQIRAAIESAHALAFVISPSSAASVHCRQELELALARNKRILPILREDPGPVPLPAPAALRQWVFFRPADDFTASLQDLVTALRSNPDHVREHTRLLVRAGEWERGARDASLLLRGNDLETAQAWLTQANVHEGPRPTPLQVEYIDASRRNEKRRQRFLLGSVTFGLVVAVALSLTAFVQRQHALSRELAASSMAQLTNDPELSLLLAMEAMEITRTKQARDALRQALLSSHVRAVMREHSRPLTGATFSPDGRLALTAAQDDRVLVWDLDSGKTVLELRGYRAAFSPDGRWIATASSDKTVRIWNAQTGTQAARMVGHTDTVGVIAFSPNGKWLATGSQDGTTRLWEARTGRSAGTPLPHTGFVTSIVFSPDSDLVAVTGFYDKVRLWKVATQTLGSELPGYHAAFSPDGKVLFTAGVAGRILFFDLDSGTRLHEIQAHVEPINAMALSPDGEILLTASYDNVARLWNTGSRELLHILVGHIGFIEAASFSADGKYIVTAGVDHTPRVWRVSTGLEVAVLRGHSEAVNTVVYDPRGIRILTSSDDRTARLWKIDSLIPLLELTGHEYTVRTAAFSPNGKLILTASEDKTARVWDAATGRPIGRALEHPDTVNSATFSPDGQTILTACMDGKARIWDTETLLPKGSPFDFADEELLAFFSPDGKRIVTTIGKGVQFWNAANGQAAGKPLQASDLVVSAAFSPDGRYIVATSLDDEARIWETSSGKLFGSPLLHPDSVDFAAFSPDSRYLVTAAEIARIWEVATGSIRHELSGHERSLYTAVFSPDGKHVLTASMDQTVRLWEASTGEPIFAWRLADEVYTASFSPDGMRVVTGSEDASVHIYACEVCDSVENQLVLASRRVTRELTAAEREKYRPPIVQLRSATLPGKGSRFSVRPLQAGNRSRSHQRPQATTGEKGSGVRLE